MGGQPNVSIAPLLVVADVSASLAFWIDIVGARPIHVGDDYALLRVGSSDLHIATTGEPPEDRPVRLVPPLDDPARADAVVVVSVADCRAFVADCVTRGLDLTAGPGEAPWGGEIRAFARDPDGHLVEFSSPA